jgi:hypothetical protein
MPVVAGILSVVAGSLSLLGSILISIGLGVFLTSTYWTGPGTADIPTVIIWMVFFLPYFIISALSIAGGIYALRRKIWGLALAGAICTLFTIWAWPLGAAAIVFLALSKDEFNHIITMSPFPPRESSPPFPPQSS